MAIDLQAVLQKASSDAEAANAAKGTAGNFINEQSIPVGKHRIRIFADKDGELFKVWPCKWVGQHRNQADPRVFAECSDDVRSRIDAALEAGHAESDMFWKNDFWANDYAYIHVIETSVKDNKYWTAGSVYKASMRDFTRDAILAGLSKFAERFAEDLTKSIDINEAGLTLDLTVEKKSASCFPDVGGDPSASPVEDIKMEQFVPLAEIFKYNEDVAGDIASFIEEKLAEVRASANDSDDEQTPPDEEGTVESQPATADDTVKPANDEATTGEAVDATAESATADSTTANPAPATGAKKPF